MSSPLRTPPQSKSVAEDESVFEDEKSPDPVLSYTSPVKISDGTAKVSCSTAKKLSSKRSPAIQDVPIAIRSSPRLKKNYSLTCRKAKLPEKEMCKSCLNPKQKRKCEGKLFQQKSSNFPSPKTWLGKTKRNLKNKPLKSLLLKENTRGYWSDFAQKCMEEEAKKRQCIEEWWLKFDRKHREQNYGSRVSLIQELSCKLFKTSNFLEVISFLLLFYGREAIQTVKNNVKMEEDKQSVNIVSISASDMLKLKCIAGGTWGVHSAYVAGLRRISLKKIKFAPLKEVIEFKKKLNCPRIHIYKNPVTGRSLGRFCTFSEILDHTFSNPSIVEHMDFRFDGQVQPIALYALYADGTRQTKVVELTNFLARSLNLKKIARTPAALQIMFLDTCKESAQVFDSVYICALKEGITNASNKGIWVICPRLYEHSTLPAEESTSSSGGRQCSICLFGDEHQPCLHLGFDGVKRFYHLVRFSCFYIYDKKASNLKLPCKPSVCHICLEELRCIKWQNSVQPEAAGNLKTNKKLIECGKKRKTVPEAILSKSCANLKRQKITVPVSDDRFCDELQKVFCEKDKLFRQNLEKFASELAVDDYHQVDISKFQESAQHMLYVRARLCTV